MWRLRVAAGSLAVGAAFALGMTAVDAQSYPARPIRLIVPFAPGGGVDFMARLMGQKLTDSLGQPVVIDNRGGAGGVIGAELAARANPDGYTLVMGNNSSHGVSQSLTPKLPYDTIKDFAPISLIASAPHLMLTSLLVPARNTREFIELAKAKPGQFNYGSSGKGSQTHLSTELFKLVTGTNLVHIPYKGVGPGFTALMSGEIHFLFASTPSSLPHVRAGRIRALAITGERRSPLLPEMPTLLESGVTGFESGPWYGLLAPAGTPAAIVARLHREIVKIVHAHDVKEKLSFQGADPVGSTPAEFAATIKNELDKWTKLVTTTGMRAN